jgi:hypothetical protein
MLGGAMSTDAIRLMTSPSLPRVPAQSSWQSSARSPARFFQFIARRPSAQHPAGRRHDACDSALRAREAAARIRREDTPSQRTHQAGLADRPGSPQPDHDPLASGRIRLLWPFYASCCRVSLLLARSVGLSPARCTPRWRQATVTSGQSTAWRAPQAGEQPGHLEPGRRLCWNFRPPARLKRRAAQCRCWVGWHWHPPPASRFPHPAQSRLPHHPLGRVPVPPHPAPAQPSIAAGRRLCWDIRPPARLKRQQLLGGQSLLHCRAVRVCSD